MFNVGLQSSESTAKELKKSAAKESAAKARAKAKAKLKTSPTRKTKPVSQPKAKGKKAAEHEPKPKQGGRVKRQDAAAAAALGSLPITEAMAKEKAQVPTTLGN